MKRVLSLIFIFALLLSLAACGGTNPDGAASQEDRPAQEQGGTPSGEADTEPAEPDTPEPAQPEQPAEPETDPAQTEEKPAGEPEKKPESKPAPEQPAQTPAPDPAPEQPAEEEAAAPENSALAILMTVWNTYGEDEKFPAAGGDSDHMTDNAPGGFDVSNTDNLSYLLTFPADDAPLIDGAASLTHMMNLNTFTCGAFHVTNGQDIAKLADDLRAGIQGKHWMCGFPDKLVLISLDGHVISMYGNEELVNTFRDKLTASYGAASILYDEAISA